MSEVETLLAVWKLLNFASDLSTHGSEMHSGQNEQSDLVERSQTVTVFEASEAACKTS